MSVVADTLCCGNYLHLVVIGVVVSFITAYGIGANDVANAFATSVGAGSINKKQAMMIAAVCEFAGAYFLGSNVTDTIRKKMLDSDLFKEQAGLIIIGMVCAEAAVAFWLLFATRFGMPVSTTHSIIGAVVGFGLAAFGAPAINWDTVGLVVASWFVSPALSAILAAILYVVVRQFILRKEDSVGAALKFFPALVGFTVMVNVFYFSPKGASRYSKGLAKQMPLVIGISVGAGVFVAVVGYFTFVKMYLENKVRNAPVKVHPSPNASENRDIENAPNPTEPNSADNSPPGSAKLAASMPSSDGWLQDMTENNASVAADADAQRVHDNAEAYDIKTEHVFTYIQVFTACVDSFGHGANDVANSIGPLAAIWAVYTESSVESKSEIPWWILFLGGIGLVVGLGTYGYKIIDAIGLKLVKVTPSRGFSIELGAAVVIVAGSILGLPLSTTHCQVGAELGVGIADGKKEEKGSGVNWPLMARIAFGWVITLVVTGGLSAALFSFAVYSPSIYGFANTPNPAAVVALVTNSTR